ncbi:family 43 glycosylhydrolase [Dysgonomonas sp. Marseille-P4677]|uniref:family 43 glycosylhydrolase n=1 Tax=Dysgonomonas sp. Marseille-P4677 TaxID=2364790 RepID=UPI001913AB46|nr:family 43 glycosylhydrolase [Dysgonomonas sp. Marseille-P4677]MBK5720333.1 family 43 glycosylhydrolase [Dysgonomonas sp. Marseille-P4677]
MKKKSNALIIIIIAAISLQLSAQTKLPSLHIDGRYLKDTHGNIVNLHGFAQTYSPWFNEMGKYWDGYDVDGCLKYNKSLIDKIMEVGWEMNFLRLHMDPHWSNVPGCIPDYHEAPNCFDENRFKKYLDEVFIPMAEYAISKGLYVIMRPPGVCPERIAVGDDYSLFLLRVWTIVAQHPKLKNHPNIMFELANEPINILGPEGDYGASSQGHFDKLKEYFQKIVDVMRSQGCDNILWIPGLGYQSLYKGYALNPIEGKNIGYAIHIYPGWFGSANGYETFKKEWDINVKPVADFAPIVVTEMDWADEKYQASWGKGHTGTAGGDGFGANFKKIVDDAGNVSWLIFTSPDQLAKFTGIPPAQGEEYTFLNDPESCPWPTYHWYKEYAKSNYPRPDFLNQSHSDNGDGTYTNPLIHADFPDPDVIRVGDIYYMVTTTMHIFPGATILKSYDLVNWEYCSNPLQMIESDDCYNMDSNCQREDGKYRYARGQWATSIKFNNGKFYLLFTTLNEGSYLMTATDPSEKWSIRKLSHSYYDPGLFFDEDGKIYIAHGISKLRITELDQEFKFIKEESVFTGTAKEGLEGAHLYKINGYYYIYATYGGFPSYQTALRSKNIFGPYEEKILLDDDNIHQGALVETQTGEWWTVLFYDKLPYGRLPNLQPIKWADNWPEIGVKVDGVNKGVKTYQKPNVGRDYPIRILPTNDNFRDYKLGLQWGWNHNADGSKWSLTERPGFLRMKTAKVTNEFIDAKNTLTQRIFGYHSDEIDSYGTIKMHIQNMQEGDVAGLGIFQKPDALIGVKYESGERKLFIKNNTNYSFGEVTNDSIIYFRAITNYGTSKARFYYSLDNVSYKQLGDELTMVYDYDIFCGVKFSIFNYATSELGGYVDVDWFSTEEIFTEDKFYDDSFVGYSEEQLTLVDLKTESNDITMLVGTSKTLKVTAIFADGREEDVTTKVTVINNNPDIIRYVNGQIVGLREGAADLTINYKSAFGDPRSLEVQVNSKMFPLISELLNPSIWTDGSFDESNGKLITGPFGFGGWEFNNGLNLSEYSHLIVKFTKPVQGGNFSFRIWDESSYWTEPAMINIADGTELLEIELKTLVKYIDGEAKPLDLSRIYRVGFWSFGNIPIYLEDVYPYLDEEGEWNSDASLHRLITEDGKDIDINEWYIVPRDNTLSENSFIIETALDAKVFIGNEELVSKKMVVNTSKPSIQTLTFKIVSPDGKHSQNYTLRLEKRFNFDDIIITRWDNTLIVNGNSSTNGGFEFDQYKWFNNGKEISRGQYYSAGPNKTDKLSGNYYVELTTKGGEVLRSWDKEIKIDYSMLMKIYPNPIKNGETVSVLLDVDQGLLDKTTIEIYNINGIKMGSTKATGNVTTIVMPSSSGIYILKAVSEGWTGQERLIVK